LRGLPVAAGAAYDAAVGGRIGARTGRVVEAGWLLPLVVTPLFFNPHAANAFELNKVAALRALVLVSVAAWLIATLAARQPARGRRDPGDRLATMPVVLPLVLLAAASTLSTAASIAPRVSLWGSNDRLQGLYTTACFVALFCVILWRLRGRDQMERIVTAVVVVSMPVSLYGLVQRFCVDPAPWDVEAMPRVASTLGNPNFLAGLLIMAVPLALARLVERCGPLLAAPRASIASLLPATCYLAALALQAAAIVSSQSRGAWLGLLGGTFVFVLLRLVLLRVPAIEPGHGAAAAAARWGARWSWLAWCVVGALLAALVVAVNVPDGPAGPPAREPFGRLFNLAESGSGRVRLLIWQAAADAMTSPAPLWSPLDGPDRLHRWRLLFGYGPETLGAVYTALLPARLPGERPDSVADRSHNETFDSLGQTGVLGLLASLGLFTGLVHAGLTGLGLIGTRAQRVRFLALWLGGGGLAVLTLRLVDASWRLAGVGLPAGMLAGLVAYIVAAAWHGAPRPAAGADRDRGLLVALLSALVAHFIEVQFGIATAASRTYFWSYAALLLVVAGASQRSWATPSGKARAPADGGVAHSVILAVVLMTLTWEFLPLALGGRSGPMLLWLLLVTAGMGVALGLGEADTPRRVPAGLGRLAGWLAVWGAADVIVLATGLSPVVHVALFALGLLGLVAIAATVTESREGDAVPPSGATPWTWVAAAALVGVAVYLGWTASARVVLADVYYKQGLTLHRPADLELAADRYRRAVAVAPHEARYHAALASALLDQAVLTRGEVGADETRRAEPDLPARAESALRRARTLEPWHPVHARQLGRLYEWRASRRRDPGARDEELARALAFYEEAVRLSPTHAWRHSDAGRVQLLMGRLDHALASYRRALAVDPDLVDGYAGLRQVHRTRARVSADPIVRQAELSRAETAERRLAELAARPASPPPARRCPFSGHRGDGDPG
jgi:hypothetical protein